MDHLKFVGWGVKYPPILEWLTYYWKEFCQFTTEQKYKHCVQLFLLREKEKICIAMSEKRLNSANSDQKPFELFDEWRILDLIHTLVQCVWQYNEQLAWLVHRQLL